MAVAYSKKRIGDDDVTIGRNLRELRHNAGFTQEEVARHLGVSFQQVQKYENGTNRLSAARLYTLMNLFGIECSAFFKGLPRS